MKFKLVAFDLLVNNVKVSINSLLIHHGIIKRHDLVEHELNDHVKKLPVARRQQCQWLLKVIDLLTKSERQANAELILNAAVYHVRNQIELTYRGCLNQFFIYNASPDNSNLYNSLTTSLNITNNNAPGKDDLLQMYSELCRFLQQHVYHSGQVEKGYLAVQAFSSKQIEGYSVEDDIKALIENESKLKVQQIGDVKVRKYQNTGTRNHERGSITRAQACARSAPVMSSSDSAVENCNEIIMANSP